MYAFHLAAIIRCILTLLLEETMAGVNITQGVWFKAKAADVLKNNTKHVQICINVALLLLNDHIEASCFYPDYLSDATNACKKRTLMTELYHINRSYFVTYTLRLSKILVICGLF